MEEAPPNPGTGKKRASPPAPGDKREKACSSKCSPTARAGPEGPRGRLFEDELNTDRAPLGQPMGTAGRAGGRAARRVVRRRGPFFVARSGVASAGGMTVPGAIGHGEHVVAFRRRVEIADRRPVREASSDPASPLASPLDCAHRPKDVEEGRTRQPVPRWIGKASTTLQELRPG